MVVSLSGFDAYTRTTISYGELPWEFPLRITQGSERWLLSSLQLWLSLAILFPVVPSAGRCLVNVILTHWLCTFWPPYTLLWSMNCLFYPFCFISSSGETASFAHHPQYGGLTPKHSSLASAEPERRLWFHLLDLDSSQVRCSAIANGCLFSRPHGMLQLSEWVFSAHYLDVMKEGYQSNEDVRD